MENDSAMSYEGVLKSADKKTVVITVERTRAMTLHKIPIIGDVHVSNEWTRADRHDVTLPFESVRAITLLKSK
ncbi:MAG: hypothetical protein JSS27_12305 [Planctomycetes bacterium]|nr:hypothetical protein [Planctomycetota bacterium]